MSDDAPHPHSVAEARAFAVAAHGSQTYGDRPYSWHLDDVAALLAPWGETAQVVGYLHDVVEDTAVGIDRVREQFGDHVADCVALVTDPPGADRAERKAKLDARLAAVEGDARLALLVKAADRLANVRASVGGAKGSRLERLLETYRREHPAFRRAAYRPGLCDDLWAGIEDVLARTADGAGPSAPRTKALGDTRGSRGAAGREPAQAVGSRGVGSLTRRRRVVPPMPRYAAKLLFQFRVDVNGDPGRRRLCEERIIHFDARSAREALRAARRRGGAATYSYLNSDGNPVSFEFVGVLDMLRLGPEVAADEVWYEVRERLMPMERRDRILPREEELLHRAK